MTKKKGYTFMETYTCYGDLLLKLGELNKEKNHCAAWIDNKNDIYMVGWNLKQEKGENDNG